MHYYLQEDNIIDADEDDQLAAAIQASLAESQKPTSSESGNTATNSSAPDTYTETPSDSDLDPYSGDDSNASTPIKRVSTNVETSNQPVHQEQLTAGKLNIQ